MAVHGSANDFQKVYLKHLEYPCGHAKPRGPEPAKHPPHQTARRDRNAWVLRCPTGTDGGSTGPEQTGTTASSVISSSASNFDMCKSGVQDAGIWRAQDVRNGIHLVHILISNEQ